MDTQEFINECIDIVGRVKTENLEEFFNNTKEAIKKNINLKDKKEALKFINTLEEYAISEREKASN